jgi:hypothetical protein
VNGIHLCPWCEFPVMTKQYEGCCSKECLRKAKRFRENLKMMKGKLKDEKKKTV